MASQVPPAWAWTSMRAIARAWPTRLPQGVGLTGVLSAECIKAAAP